MFFRGAFSIALISYKANMDELMYIFPIVNLLSVYKYAGRMIIGKVCTLMYTYKRVNLIRR